MIGAKSIGLIMGMAVVVLGIQSAQASIVLRDTFTDTAGTALNSHTVDTTSTDANWSGSGGTVIAASGSAATQVSNGNENSIGFTALGAGQTLIYTFKTEHAGFGQSTGQGFEMALHSANGKIFSIGDTRQDYRPINGNTYGASVGSWYIGQDFSNTGAAWASTSQHSTSSDGTVDGTFTYAYDTGAWSLSLVDTETSTSIWSTSGATTTLDGSTYAPASEGINKLSFKRESARRVDPDMVQVQIIPEPATLGMVALFGGGILFIRRKLMV